MQYFPPIPAKCMVTTKCNVIIPVFVGNKESAFNVTTIWVLSLFVENFHVMIEVIQIDCSVEGEHNDLRDLLGGKGNMINYSLVFN